MSFLNKDELTHKEKWMASMKAKLNTDEAGVREFMRQSGEKAARTGKGGFTWLKANDPDKLKQISNKGIKSRGTNRPTNNSN